MELKTYLAVLGRRKWVVIVATAVTLIVVIVGTLLLPPQYVAAATLRVPLITSATDEVVRSSDLLYADRLMNTYERIATSRPILEELERRVGRSPLPQVDVALLPETELMRISVRDPDPVLAAEVANAMAEILIAQGRGLYTGVGKTAQELLGAQLTQMEREVSQARSDYERLVVEAPNDTERLAATRRLLELREETYGRLLEQYERAQASETVRQNTISLVEPAVVPTSHTSPDKSTYIGLGFLAGLVAGVGLAFLFDHLDTTLHTADKIQEVTRLPVLGQIPAAEGSLASALPPNNSTQEEAFRRLRIAIAALERDPAPKTLLLLSVEPDAAKSTIVGNLARIIAQTRQRVAVVDGDMRDPALHTIFGVPNEVGLSSVLSQKVELDSAIQSSIIPGLQILTSGPLSSNPAGLLGSPKMRSTLGALSQKFDMVLLDAPALHTAADAEELALLADGVILIVQRGRSQEAAVRDASTRLATLKAQLLGVIVSRADGPATTTVSRPRGRPIGSTLRGRLQRWAAWRTPRDPQMHRDKVR